MAVLGDDLMQTWQTLIQARREASVENTPWYSRLLGDTGQKALIRLLKHGTISQIEQRGYLPADIVEAGLDISTLCGTPSQWHAFGFVWDDLVSLGLTTRQLQKFSWAELSLFKVSAPRILALTCDIHDILSLDLTIQQLHTLGFTMKNLLERGATQELLTEKFTAEDVNMYLKGAPSAPSAAAQIGAAPRFKSKAAALPGSKSVTFEF